jgi:hypothetical protein
MVEQRGTIRGALALLLTAGALLGVSGCASRQARFETTPARAAEQTAPVVTSAAASVAPDAAAETSTGSGSSSATGLSATDASTLDAELSAIQSELDRLSVPSDSDFDNIGEGLK